jgi:hypothetical protein
MSENKEAPAKASQASKKYASPKGGRNTQPGLHGSAVVIDVYLCHGKIAVAVVNNSTTGAPGFNLPLENCASTFFANEDVMYYGSFAYKINGSFVMAATKKGNMYAKGHVFAYDNEDELMRTLNYMAGEYNKVSKPYVDPAGRFKLPKTTATAGSALMAPQFMSEVLGIHKTAEVVSMLYENYLDEDAFDLVWKDLPTFFKDVDIKVAQGMVKAAYASKVKEDS